MKCNFRIKSLSITLLAVLGAAPFMAGVGTPPPPATKVCGLKVYDSRWEGSIDKDAGVYSIEVRQGGAVKCLKRVESMSSVVAGVKKDNVMYCMEMDGTGVFYRQYSASTWVTVGTRQETDDVNLPSDLTYDPVTGRVYGAFFYSDYNEFSRFGYLNLSTAEATQIKLLERDIFAIAADGTGKLYALYGAFDYVATIDPRTGEVNRIKTSGLSPFVSLVPVQVSSMCYDEANDRLIAAVVQEDGYGANKRRWSGLYTINPHTGEVTEVMQFEGTACFAGLHMMDDTVDPEAPDAVTGAKVEFDPSDPLKGSVRFTAPVVTAGGAPLTGSLMVIVSVNGAETLIDNVAPGSEAVSPRLTFSQGANTLKLTACTESLRGQPVTLDVWGGEDVPVKPSDVTLTVADGKASITWTAPDRGVNGGAVYPDRLKYTVVRMPDNVKVAENLGATSFTDTSIPEGMAYVYYTVSATSAAGTGEAAVSAKSLVSGALQVPFTETFDTADAFDIWTVDNVNGGATWKWYSSSQFSCASYQYDPDKLAADDWLFSPAVELHAGVTYKVTYDWRVYSKTYDESFRVMLGNAPSPAAMNVALGDHPGVKNTSWENGQATFTVESDGLYYLGVQCYSDAYKWHLYVDNIGISALDSRVPAAVTEIAATPGSGGVLEATLSFTLPEKDVEGADLVSITSVVIRRSGADAAVAELTDGLTPGVTMSWTDTSVPESGSYTYTVTVANEVGESAAATVRTFVGTDAPGAVRNLSVTETDGHAVLTWEAPESGANGGWFDASALTYRIVRGDGTVVAESHSGLAFTDTGFAVPSSGQTAQWWLVTPYCGDTKGAYAQSQLTLFGSPYPAPLAESFAGADMAYYPWIAQSATALNYSWTLDEMGYNPSVSDQNGDRGLATFHSVGEPVGAVSYFYSPKISLAGLDNPMLSFWLYHAEGEGDGSVSLLLAAGSDEFNAVGEPIARTSATGWKRYSVSLAQWKDSDWIRIGFAGTVDGVADIYLDNVTVDNGVMYDLAVSAFSVPSRIAAGEKAEVSVTVLNAGAEAAEGAVLTVADASGGELAAMDVETLASGAELRVPLEFDLPAEPVVLNLTASVTLRDDSNPANDSRQVVVNVVEPVVPGVTGLEATVNDEAVVLTWQDPSRQGAVTDDVESYPDWAIDGIGEWSMWDGDYDLTHYINKDLGEYPNATARKAFQVCNARTLGIDIWPEGEPHSGDRMFMALASMNYVNNDWLISPRLNGSEQWISFFARSFTLQDTPAERMRVLYSLTDADPAAFTAIGSSDYVELPGQWQEYRYYLPEGARYFAVNCVSDGSFAMFVDDLSFNDMSVPRWELTGYEVWCGGELIGTSGADDPSFTDTEFASRGAKPQYAVKAVYDKGVSALCEPVVPVWSGIGLTGSEALRVSAIKGAVVVDSPADADIRVVTPSGVVAAGVRVPAGHTSISVAPGVYVVTCASGAVKVIVP